MTISTERRATPIILGTGANADIPFDFKVFRAEDILLVKSDGLNIESTLVLGNDYSVVLNPNQNEDAGGFVKLKVALATGERAIITTNAPSLQETRLINQGGFYPDVLNNAFDYLTILIQQLETQIERVVLLPITTKIDKEKFTRNLAFLTEHVNELDALFNILSHIVIVSRISKEVVIVSKIEKDVTAVANNNTNVTKVADNETNINAVQANETNINTVSLNIACLESICKNMLALLAVCKNETNITKVANNETNITKVANNEPNINKVAGNETNINSAVRNEKNITSAVRNETNINKVADNETNITKTAANEQNINKLVANETNINTVASIDSDVTTVATNVADVTNFSDVYLGKRNVKPTTRTDGTALETGDLYFDTVKKSILVYDKGLAAWTLVSSVINAILKQFYFVATAGQNVFKGNDDNNKLLEFELDYIEIFLNGVHLNPEDFTLDTTNQSITLKEVASEKDELYVRSFGALALPSQEIKNILTIKQKILDVSAKLKEIEGIEKKLKEIVEVHGVVKEIGGLAKIQTELKLLHEHINELKLLFSALPQIRTIAADLKNIDTVATKLKTKIDIIVKDKEAIDKVALIDGEIKTIFNNLDAILKAGGAVVSATESMAGIAKIATQAETTAGIIDNKIVTPLKLEEVLAALELNIREELSELKKVGDVYAKEIDKNSNRLVTHRTDIQQNTTDIVSNTASIATIINTIKKGITTDKLAQSFTVPSVLHDKIKVIGGDDAGHYGYAVAMHNDYLAVSDPVLQEVVIYHRDKNNKKIFNIEDVHKGKKHGDMFGEDEQIYIKRSDGVHLDVFKYDETQATLTFKKVSSINLTASYGNSLAINDSYLIVGNPQSKTVLVYQHSGIHWQLVKQLTGGDSFGSSVAVTDNYIIIAEPDNKKTEVFDLNFNKVRTITGGASFGKLIDYSSKALAIAETGNSKVSFYKDELVPSTIKDIILEKKITGENLGYNQFVSDRWWVLGSDKNSFFDIYENVKGTWTKKQRFSDTRGDFGDDISIYDNTMVLASDKNYVKIYDYDGNNWVFKKEIASRDNFGFSVSIYKDTLVVGANNGNYAEVWQRVNNIWSKVKTLNGSGSFGVSVSIYKDTLVVGAHHGNYVEIWQRVNNIWSKVKTLGGLGKIGYSVSIYKDTLVVGALFGSFAEIWQRVNNIWSKVRTLGGGGSLGTSVSIYKDTIVVGAPYGNYVDVWQRFNNVWSKVKTLKGSGDFGYRLKNRTDKFITAGSKDGSYSELYKINYNTVKKLIGVGVYNKNTDSIAVTNDKLLVVDKTNTTANIYDDKVLLKSFTIDTNYGDACAITTDKILITNKTDSKLVIYDHKGTKEKEIQLEAGVGSVIDATDTEAVVGSEKANKFEAISLT